MKRKALLTSILSLLLCVSMLVGTTFAWFTDSVSNGINKIHSGNLDVELYYFDQSNDFAETVVTPDLKLFRNVDGEDILWEPGASAGGWFKVVNEGTLALKYQLSLNFANATETPEGKTLADILTGYAMVSAGITGDDGVMEDPYLQELHSGAGLNSSLIPGYENEDLKDMVLEGWLLPGEGFVYHLGIEWKPSDIDNEFNVKGGLDIDVGVTLVATQMTYEKDWMDDQYDKDAQFPVVGLPPIDSAEDLMDAVANGGEFVLGADIALPEALVVPAGVQTTIDLNGYDITANNAAMQPALIVEGDAAIINTGDTAIIGVESGANTANTPAIEVAEGASLTFEDGAIDIRGGRNSSGIQCYGELNISGGEVFVCGSGNTYGIMALNGATVNMTGGDIIVDSEANNAYGIFGMHGRASEVNLNGGKITVVNGKPGHYGVAVMEATLYLNIVEGFDFAVAEGANAYGSLSGAPLFVNGVQQ